MIVPPKVFISYTWEDDSHKSWVRSLASRLRSDGFDVTLDQWHTVPGDQLPEFMERAVRENDFVLIICTPKYKVRSDARTGGVGYEGDIMSAEVLTTRNNRKFIPILRNAEWYEAAPSWLLGKFYIDLRGISYAESSYDTLTATLLGKRPAIPPIGELREQPDQNWKAELERARTNRIVTSLNPIARGRYKLIAFDLDGTLLKGIDFSWRLVWKYLGYTEELRRRGMQLYLAGSMNYKEWCKYCCDYFIGKGLKRADFNDITATISLTRNFHDTMKILRQEGFVVAMISGGINTFIDEIIPDADDWFDYVFVNRFVYDENGFLIDVVPTPFDFASKLIAIELICEEHRFCLDQAVFVGEGFNDDHIASKVGLSIAYPPTSQGFGEAAHIKIDEDDLSLILPHVLVK